MMMMVYNSWCSWGGWWLWCCGDDDDVDENEKRKRWFVHLTLIYSFIWTKIILCYDATCCWIWLWLSVKIHEYKFAFYLKWQIIIIYLFLIIRSAMISLHLLIYLFAWCRVELTFDAYQYLLMYRCYCALIFIKYIVCSNIWDMISTLARSCKLRFKGEYHERAILDLFITFHVLCLGTKTFLYWFLFWIFM